MSRIIHKRTTRHPFHTVFVLTLMFVTPALLPAQAPRVGEIQQLSVITISMQAGSTDKETKRVTYTPPPGWYVRSHRVDCTRKTGLSSYSVATVPRAWGWTSEEKIEESYKTLIDLAGKAGNRGLQARFALEQGKALGELRKVRSSHHALVVDATAKGEGFLRGIGSIDLTVTAELVFVGTSESLDETIARHRKTLSKPPAKTTTDQTRRQGDKETRRQGDKENLFVPLSSPTSNAQRPCRTSE